MMYIDIGKLPPLTIEWKKKTEECLIKLETAASIGERNILIDKFQWYWKMFKTQLKTLSYNKCWYSETRNPYSHYHVDHFRPKKKVIEFDGAERDGYWWLSLDRTNYRLSGSVGNTKKKDNFAVKQNTVIHKGPVSDEVIYFLDPTCREDVKLLNFDNNGKAIPSGRIENEKWNYERADYTIKYLDLNYPDLVEERKMKYQEVTFLIKKINEQNAVYNNEPTNQNKHTLESKKNEVRKMLAPCSELTSTVRACLRSCGQNWAYLMLEENINLEFCNENNL